METPQTEKLRKFYNMVAPHLVGHRTAHNLFWDVVHELEEHADAIEKIKKLYNNDEEIKKGA